MDARHQRAEQHGEESCDRADDQGQGRKLDQAGQTLALRGACNFAQSMLRSTHPRRRVVVTPPFAPIYRGFIARATFSK